MAIFNQFPWVNYKEYNLDWVIRTVKSALEDVSDAVSQYFADHIDTTLTQSGDAADAYATGTRIGSVQSSVTTLAGRVTTAEGTITSLDTRMTTAETAIADMETVYMYVRTAGLGSPINDYQASLQIHSGSTQAATAQAMLNDYANNRPFTLIFRILTSDEPEDYIAYNIKPNMMNDELAGLIFSAGDFTMDTGTATPEIADVYYNKIVLRDQGNADFEWVGGDFNSLLAMEEMQIPVDITIYAQNDDIHAQCSCIGKPAAQQVSVYYNYGGSEVNAVCSAGVWQ